MAASTWMPTKVDDDALCALSAKSYRFLQSYVQRESGIVLDDDKQYLLQARLLPIVQREQLGSLDELCDRIALGRPPHLAGDVIDAMTTNETLFFRDVQVFDSLQSTVLPLLIEATRGQRKMRIWSAASSTGQEAYSLAMMLLNAGYKSSQFEIVGTDLSQHAVDRARAGKYATFEVGRGLPTPNLMKYFSKTGLDWQIKDDIRSAVRFEKADLRGNLSAFGQFDLILCRNVLIYFNSDTKRQIVSSLARRLLQRGIIVLGCAETLIGMDESFERSVYGKTTLYSLR
jgi:chemotaxis protein methyltransferase CheR